ncbi:MAG: hypothetical protein KHZ66_08860, partial [Lacticaseibacillus rhamnosus]|nr:hypothetical protein [Lacticaseibacillus rhamnosus]
ILSINNATWAKKSDVSNSLSEYYTKEQVDSLVSNLKKATITVVPTLPATGEEGIIYLVGTSAPYEQYVWDGSAWIDLGSTEIDLFNYVNTTGTLTAEHIILGDGTKKVKASGKTIASSVTNDANSVPTSHAVKTYADAELAKKQDKLTEAQLNAVNSGITGAKVAKYDGYDAEIKSKQNRLHTEGSAIHINANNSIYLDSSGTGATDISVINCQKDGDEYVGFIKNTLIVPGGGTLLVVYAAGAGNTTISELTTAVTTAFSYWSDYWKNAQTEGTYLPVLAAKTMTKFHFPQFINWQSWEVRWNSGGKALPNTGISSNIVFKLSSTNVDVNGSGKVSYQAEVNLFDILEEGYNTEQLCVDAITQFLESATGNSNSELYAKSTYLKIRLSFKYDNSTYTISDIKLNSSLYVMPD